ncbi:MAG TPA: FtsQ-type POTRA domain-containing protein [Thermoleophilaceae bacterium]|nr:FtsQ-type POTRA domain-containing protein [Thermoleophilaceae bacterium]
MKTAAAATLKRLPRISLTVPPHIRRRALVVLLIVCALFAIYRLWFRNSSFVSVQHVSVSGLTTSDAGRIRLALVSAAHDMSTLDVNQSALNGAVSGFPVVKAVVAKPSFPHTLKIHVIEEQPTAVLAVGGERLLLAPDGTVLRGVTTGHPLALIKSRGAVPQQTLTDRVPLSALHVAAAAPAALAGRITSVGHDKEGIVVHLRNGPRLIFGTDSRAFAKWAAVAAVLADPTSKGATYVDVRLPGRAVAGGLDAQTLAPISSVGNDVSAQSNDQGATGTTGPTNPQLSTGG